MASSTLSQQTAERIEERVAESARGLMRPVREWLATYLRAADAGRADSVALPPFSKAPGCTTHSAQLVELLSALAHVAAAAMLENRARAAAELDDLSDLDSALADDISQAESERRAWSRAEDESQALAERSAARLAARLAYRAAGYALLSVVALLADSAVLFTMLRQMFAVGNNFISDSFMPLVLTIAVGLTTTFAFHLALSPNLRDSLSRRLRFLPAKALPAVEGTVRAILVAFGIAVTVVSVFIRRSIFVEGIAGWELLLVLVILGSAFTAAWAVKRYSALRREALEARELSAAARENRGSARRMHASAARQAKALRARKAALARRQVALTDRLVRRTLLAVRANVRETVQEMARVRVDHEEGRGCGSDASSD